MKSILKKHQEKSDDDIYNNFKHKKYIESMQDIGCFKHTGHGSSSKKTVHFGKNINDKKKSVNSPNTKFLPNTK